MHLSRVVGASAVVIDSASFAWNKPHPPVLPQLAHPFACGIQILHRARGARARLLELSLFVCEGRVQIGAVGAVNGGH